MPRSNAERLAVVDAAGTRRMNLGSTRDDQNAHVRITAAQILLRPRNGFNAIVRQLDDQQADSGIDTDCLLLDDVRFVAIHHACCSPIAPIGHSEVHDWYNTNIVPELSDPYKYHLFGL